MVKSMVRVRCSKSHFTVKTLVSIRSLKTKKKFHSIAFLNMKNGKTVPRTTIHGKSSTIKVCGKLNSVK